MQNEVLFRFRGRGVNFGGAIVTNGGDILTPYYIKLKLNQKYNEFLAATRDNAPYPIRIVVPTVAQTNRYALRPAPNDPSNNLNPAVARLIRVDYTYMNGAVAGSTRRIRGMGTQKFDAATFQGTMRLGAYANIPAVWAQMVGDPSAFDLYPGTATTGDQLTLTIVPDPQATGRLNAGVTCANGGPMSADNDVPLIQDEFHGALVEGALDDMLRMVDRKVQADDCRAKWLQYLEDANTFGVLQGEGESDQIVEDVYPDPLNFG